MQGPSRHVIAAMGVSSALGDSLEATWTSLAEARPIVRTPAFDLPFSAVCGTVDGPLEPLTGRFARYDTRLTRIALRALSQVMPAVERARARFGRERIGVLVGTSTGGLDTTEPAYRHRRRTGELPANYSLRDTHAFDALARFAAERLDLAGPAYAISTACTSSAKAIATAGRLMNRGMCDAVLVIGADALCETTLRGFHALSVLSSQPARPFSRERNGIHIGEAAACLLLEREGQGPAAITGTGETSDAHTMSAPHPEGLGAATAMRLAIAHAGLDVSDIDYVNAHGTGTPQNDAAESLAIRAVLPAQVPVSSTKGLTGHTLGACGALEVIITVLALQRGALPVSAGATPRDEALDVRVVTEPTPARIRHALSNSFAFGGSNAALVISAS
jgi:3-oxoacyl-[acyl-carrier-protein] synthase-1